MKRAMIVLVVVLGALAAMAAPAVAETDDCGGPTGLYGLTITGCANVCYSQASSCCGSYGYTCWDSSPYFTAAGQCNCSITCGSYGCTQGGGGGGQVYGCTVASDCADEAPGGAWWQCSCDYHPWGSECNCDDDGGYFPVHFLPTVQDFLRMATTGDGRARCEKTGP